MDYGERRSFGGGGQRFGGGNRDGGAYGGFRGGGGGGGPRRSSGGGGGGGFSPVKEGEEINAVIEAVAEKGDGIAKKAGFVIFVPGTKVGDKVKIRVKKVAKKVAFAEVIGPYDENAAPAATAAPVEQAAEAAPAEAEPEEQYDASQDSEEF